MWYSAHIVIYVRFLDENQNKFPIWENVVLIEASDRVDAYQLAEAHGRNMESDESDAMTWEDRPAMMVFGGIRKLIEEIGRASCRERVCHRV